ncbi:hypothetical protein PG994_013789 [Apiospora phragmitis]|uniref:Uncharacterized protein n=1 Tax=Apiospora phragmitis TaxID=2905665 RepID=A0ABR1T2G7_9PEZI
MIPSSANKTLHDVSNTPIVRRVASPNTQTRPTKTALDLKAKESFDSIGCPRTIIGPAGAGALEILRGCQSVAFPDVLAESLALQAPSPGCRPLGARGRCTINTDGAPHEPDGRRQPIPREDRCGRGFTAGGSYLPAVAG